MIRIEEHGTGGRSALALRLLLGAMSKRISSSAGVATGEEFRAARKAAEEIGAQIVLGDRPIEITVSSQTWNLETL
jgi:pheromone shutdown protein TraB